MYVSFVNYKVQIKSGKENICAINIEDQEITECVSDTQGVKKGIKAHERKKHSTYS